MQVDVMDQNKQLLISERYTPIKTNRASVWSLAMFKPINYIPKIWCDLVLKAPVSNLILHFNFVL